MIAPDLSSLDAERRVLGALMHENRLLWRIGDLTPDDFSSGYHGQVFDALRWRIREGEPTDALTLWEGFGQQGELAYLTDMQRDVFVPQVIPELASIVRRYAQRRQTLAALETARARIADPTSDPENAIAETMAALDGALHRRGQDLTFEQCLSAYDELEAEREARQADGQALGLSTTIPTLDTATSRLYGPRLYILAARPGSFKSVLAWQIAIGGGLRDTPVGFCSLEMDAAELGGRVYRSHGKNIRRGLPVYVDDKSHTLDQICGRIVEWKNSRQIQLAVVDHLQLVSTAGRNRHEEVSEITRRLKLLAKQLSTPIMLLSQISREVEKEKREPRLSDLRESGNIEQDADAVFFLHHTPSKDGRGTVGDQYELLIAKNRDGPARGKPIPLICDGAHMNVKESVL